MHADLVWVTVALLSFPQIILCDPLNVMLAPNILHVGTDEKVFVEAQDYSGNDLQVTISIKDYPQKRYQVASATTTLTAANNFQSLVNIKIHASSGGPLEKQYGYLQAQFPTGLLEKVVLVSPLTGYIFVQTDKSIYTPGTTVSFRIFLLNLELKPDDRAELDVDIINPQGNTVNRQTMRLNKGFVTGQYRIPELVKFGTWSIAAQYENNPQKNFTAEFETKDYVLPSFEVAFKLPKPFFYVEDETFEVEIIAKYLFGKNVDGVAFVVFGVRKDKLKIRLTGSLSRETITNGVGRAVLTKTKIQQAIPNINDLEGDSLFISVSVLTQTGSEMVKAERGGIQIVKSPYTIEFKKTPKYFHPGMSFDVAVYVTNPDQSPAEDVDVVIKVDQDQREVKGRTKSNGMAKVIVNTQGGWKTVDITARTDVPGISAERQAQNKMIAEAYATKEYSGNYLHISADSAELQINADSKFLLNFKSSVQDQDLTYLILSKGQIVKAERYNRKGQSIISLSERITKDLVPSFRLVAYYHVGSEVVSDSIWVDVKDTCMGTLKLSLKDNPDGKIFELGDEFKLVVTGDPSAKVGLVAVDKGVFVLNKNRLTQSKIWNLIEKYDTGCTAGSGKDSMGVFYDAGLLFESDKAGGTKERTDNQCPTPPKRKRRAEITQTLDDDNDDDFISSDEIVSRTQFPESWLWEDINLPACSGNQCTTTSITMERLLLKDSITTWQLLAISLSKTHGICVADPFEITVAKDFFVDLKLPYSAVHNEQVEIKAILYNFSKKRQMVRVEFFETENICSAASKKEKYRTIVNVGPNSSISVPFVFIPMKIGEHHIEVQAASSSYDDGVRRTLKVVSEGVLTKQLEANMEINPSQAPGGVQVVQLSSEVPSRQVPNTDAHTYITVVGQKVSQTIKQAISGDFMGRLIVQPTGSGEQNMIYMTLPLIATHYLDTTKQWEGVGLGRRYEAIQHITTGYVRELTYRKPDGSYAALLNRPSSIWLTAYVAKVFAMASDLINIEENVICSAIKWLTLNVQMPDGTFIEKAPVVQSEMVGDVQGRDSSASLTAFVLIALQESNHLCAASVGHLLESSNKALSFLERRLPFLTNPYAIAMTSYALANAGKFNKDRLLQASSEDGSYWQVPGGQFFSVEATAYALLALVKAKEFNAAGKVVRWLNRQSINYGGHGTTQATIMVFQAVAEYYKQVSHQEKLDLMVEVSVSGVHRPIKWNFNNRNSHLTRSYKVQLKQKFNVTATGTGAAVLRVMTIYYAKSMETKKECKKYSLSVEMKRKAKVSYTDAEESYELTIEVLYKDPYRDATMTILDIGLLTGYVVDKSDRTDLSSGNDKYIQMTSELSERGSLIIYIDKVSHTVPEIIAFSVHKINKVDMLQPAAVTVYEHNSPGERCVKFYHPTKKEGALRRLCSNQGGLCECAEENCSIQKKLNIKDNERMLKACDSDFTYVYKVKVVEMNLNPNTDFYTMEIEEILREGIDLVEPGNQRTFMGHADCRSAFNFVKGKSYLLIGQRSNLLKEDSRLLYILGEKTWIEYWPTSVEGQTIEYKENYQGITALANALLLFGCV